MILVMWFAMVAASIANPCQAQERVDATTLSRKLIMGYQGWFACPGDALGHGWVHWSSGGAPTVDMLPDVTELPAAERCHTNMTAVSGKPVDLFSDQNAATVDRQFAWMQHYGLDGVALQRFPSRDAWYVSLTDRVLANVRDAAEAHGRVFFVMYDLSGVKPEDYALVLADWERLEGQGITHSKAYLRHRGHPLLGLWGLGFNFPDRPMTPRDAWTLIMGFSFESANKGGITILGGVPAGWHSGSGDADPDPGWRDIWPLVGVISPWTVGRYSNQIEADRFRLQKIEPDLAEAARIGVDYMPVVFPGGSNANGRRVQHQSDKVASNDIPRQCGRFYWRQVWNALSAGATMIYGAMFDEVDEGTAMFKIVATASEAPADTADTSFVTLDADGCQLPSDWYLQLAGAATRALKGRGAVSPRLPLPLPGR